MRKYYCIIVLLVFYNCKRDDSTTKIKACFNVSPSYDLKVYDTIQFSNCSENSVKFNWDFGDGDYSFDKNPKHIFVNPGNYKIRLAALNDNILDTISKNLTISRNPDRIIYTNLNPYISLKSIDSIHQVGTTNPYCSYTSVQTYPSSGSVYFDLDIDSNASKDFIFRVYHQPITCGSYSKCSGYNYYSCILSMSGLNSEDSFFSDWKQGSFPKLFNLNDTINFGIKNELTDWTALIGGGCAGTPLSGISDIYVGIKINNNYGWIHLVSFYNGIYIKDFAINMTEHNPIIAGQKK